MLSPDVAAPETQKKAISFWETVALNDGLRRGDPCKALTGSRKSRRLRQPGDGAPGYGRRARKGAPGRPISGAIWLRYAQAKPKISIWAGSRRSVVIMN